MAEDTIIIDVQLSDSEFVARAAAVEQKINDLKKANQLLRQAVKTGQLTQEEAAKQMERNNAAIKRLQLTHNSYQKTIQATTKNSLEYGDSLNEMRRRLSDMQNEYAALSKAERENENVGGALLRQIRQQDEAVKSAEASMGDYRRNVGNYGSAVKGFIPFFDKLESMLTNSAGGFSNLNTVGINALTGIGAQLKRLFALIVGNPAGLALTAIAAALAAVARLVGSFSAQLARNDSAGTKWAKMLASFQPLLDGIRKTLNDIVEFVGNAAEKVGSFFAGLSEDAKAAQELVQAADDLQERQRQYVVSQAKNNKEIEELRTKSRDREQYDVKTRLEMLEKANELARQNAEERKNIAKENLNIMIANADKEKDTSDATMDRIAQARAEVFNAERDYYTRIREIGEQERTFKREEAAEEKRLADEEKKREEERVKRAQAAAAKRKEIEQSVQELEKQVQDAYILMIQDENERAYKTLETRGKREIQALKERKGRTEEERNALNELIKAKESQLASDLNGLREKQRERERADAEKRMQEDLDREEKRLSLLLEVASRKGQEYFDLRERQLALQRQKELQNTSLTEQERNAILKKYANMQKQIEKEKNSRILEERKKALNAEMAQNQLRLEQEQASAKERAIQELKDLKENYKLLAEAEYASEEERKAVLAKAEKEILQARRRVTAASIDEVLGMLDAFKSIGAAVNEILSTVSEDSKEFAAVQKAMALFNIGISLATSIANVVKVATQSSFTVWDLVANIATGIGAVTAAIIQAKKAFEQTEEPQFATGGVVGGTSYTGDNVRARVNSGEMILTRGQQAQLFQIANEKTGAGIDYDRLGSVMAAAVAAQRPPIVDLREWTLKQKEISTIKEQARL